MPGTPVKLDYATPPGREGRFTLTRTAHGGTIILSSAPAKSAFAWAGAMLFAILTACCFFASLGEAIAMLGAPERGDGPLVSVLVVSGIASLLFLRGCAQMLRPAVVRIDGPSLYLLRPPWLAGNYRKWRRDEVCAVHAVGGQLRLTLRDEAEVVLLNGFRRAEYPMLSQATDMIREWLEGPERALP